MEIFSEVEIFSEMEIFFLRWKYFPKKIFKHTLFLSVNTKDNAAGPDTVFAFNFKIELLMFNNNKKTKLSQ